jgi:hypothetical protein
VYDGPVEGLTPEALARIYGGAVLAGAAGP